LNNIYWSLLAIVSVAVAIAVTLHFVLKGVEPPNFMVAAYGQSLDDLVGETLQQQSYRAELMDFINKSYYNDDLYAMLTLLPKEQIAEERVVEVLVLPTLSLNELEEIAKTIISVNNSQIFLQNAITKANEQQGKDLILQREEEEKKDKFYLCLSDVPGGITSNNKTAINECATSSGFSLSDFYRYD
jgi:hypothetical protein